MGKFKDKLDRLEGGKPNNLNPNNLQNNTNHNTNPEKCEPGRTINFKTKQEAPTPPVPPGGPGGPVPTIDTGQICDCISTKIDELIDDVRNTYPYGTSFNTGKLFTQTATPVEIDAAITSPSSDPSIIGFYDAIPVAPKRNNLNARQIWIIADPDGAVNPNDPFLYVKYTNGPSAEYSVEVPVRVGEDWEFRDVYEFRIRASVEGQQYRITTDPHHTTFVSTIVNVPTISGQLITQVTVSGNIVQVSGQQVFIASESGQFIATDISGVIVSIVNASGQCLCANVSGDVVLISGQSVNVSGSIIFVVNASGQNITDISGQFVAIDDIDPITQFRELIPALTLNSGENDLTTAVIDNINGFAYFGTTNGTAADSIIKVDLRTLTRVSSIILNSGEAVLLSAAIDIKNQFAYFGTSSTPDGTRDTVVKIDLSTFTRVGSLTLTSGDAGIASAVIEPINGIGFFGTNNGTPSDRIVQIKLADFSLITSFILFSGQAGLVSAVLDSGFVYFGTDNGTPADQVIQLNMSGGAPAVVTLNSGEKTLNSAVIDNINHVAYFGTGAGTGTASKIVKVNVLDAILFNRVGALTLSPGEFVDTGVINTDTGFSYFGTNQSPGKVVKVATSRTSFFRVGVVTLNSGEDSAQSAIIDTLNGFAYFGTNTSPGIVVKLAIDFNTPSIPSVNVSGNIVQISGQQVDISGQYVAIDDVSTVNQFRELSSITLNSGELNLESAVIDNQNGFAYFGTVGGSVFHDSVVKINLSNFTRENSIVLNSGEEQLNCAIIDTANNFAYFGTSNGTPNDSVVKIDLSTFTRAGSIVLNSGEKELKSAVIDDKNGFAYFGTDNGTLIHDSVVKINLASFSRVGAVTLNSGEVNLESAVIESGFAYFGTVIIGKFNDSITRINLTTFTRDASISLNSGEKFTSSAIIDRTNRLAYFGTVNGTPNDSVVKIDLSTFTRVGAVVLNSGEVNLCSAIIDTKNQFAYFGASLTAPGKIVKINTSPSNFSRIGAITLNSGEITSDLENAAVIDDKNGFGYFGTLSGQIVKIAIDFQELSIPAVTVSGNIVRLVGNTLSAGYTKIGSISGGVAIGSGFIIHATVKNISGNANIWIGPSGIQSGTGFLLMANETTPEIKTNNLANIFGYAVTSGQNVSWIATNE